MQYPQRSLQRSVIETRRMKSDGRSDLGTGNVTGRAMLNQETAMV
jgi:hypothetical protein